ncbi:FAD dependent oxidoreductase [Babesia caballi]|uniref:FAD dependent oxidoreductase n=1 Tax=Babesia caballi TaxID=5871 RepID=A0AAV4LY01_BABCB|nr:FAD dependent oxidoreductase [Babesia caballi]
MSEPSRLESFHVKDPWVTNRQAIYVRACDPPSETDAQGTLESDAEGVAKASDAVLLRNILLCFHFLDHEDRTYVNPGEAENYIKLFERDNQKLFELLNCVLGAAKGANEADNIGKELFIKRVEQSVRALVPLDASPMYQLRRPVNAVSKYFDGLRPGSRVGAAGDKDSLVVTPEEASEGDLKWATYDGCSGDPDDALDSQSDKECTFKPVTNRRRYPGKDGHPSNGLRQEIEDMQRYKCGTGGGNGMNEYIVFHFNRRSEWSKGLRSLRDPST